MSPNICWDCATRGSDRNIKRVSLSKPFPLSKQNRKHLPIPYFRRMACKIHQISDQQGQNLYPFSRRPKQLKRPHLLAHTYIAFKHPIQCYKGISREMIRPSPLHQSFPSTAAAAAAAAAAATATATATAATTTAATTTATTTTTTTTATTHGLL